MITYIYFVDVLQYVHPIPNLNGFFGAKLNPKKSKSIGPVMWGFLKAKHLFVESDLVGGFNPSEKYARQTGFIFPNFWVEK